MDSVQCRISDKEKPELWIEIEIGVNDDDKRFWTLTRKSPVSFNAFHTTKGTWDYARISLIDGSNHSEDSDGISVNGDGLDGFVLAGVPKDFHRMVCGQVRSGTGFRGGDVKDVRYRMEILRV